jgi:hypothetical protein
LATGRSDGGLDCAPALECWQKVAAVKKLLFETVFLSLAATWLAACLLLLNAAVRYYDATPGF